MDIGTDHVITLGRQAWLRLCHRDRVSFEDWLAVAKALDAGRIAALKTAGTDKPFGKRYSRAMALFLESHGFEAIEQQVRHRCKAMLENLSGILAWRETLTDAERRRWSHPDTIMLHYRKSRTLVREPTTRCAATIRREPVASTTRKSTNTGRGIQFSQDHVRRAATALRESWSRDFYVMARAVLEAAIPDREALMALLPDPPVQVPRERSAALVHA